MDRFNRMGKPGHLTVAALALSATISMGLSPEVNAYQPDGPHATHAKRNAAKWAEEDKEIDAKLAALEKKFGKKPNIIYVLTDDVGWGELGWQGGGKHRGTPTPELDKMAHEGMRFWTAYAEPSCTPSRMQSNSLQQW